MENRSGRDTTGQGSRVGLSSHSFSKNLKKYATESGLESIHIHQTRHTFARMVSEDTGSLVEMQEALGHRNLATTRVYVNSIVVKKDKHSGRISERLGIEGSGYICDNSLLAEFLWQISQPNRLHK